MSGNARGPSTAFNLLYRLGQVLQRVCGAAPLLWLPCAVAGGGRKATIAVSVQTVSHMPTPIAAAATRPARAAADAGPQGLALHPRGEAGWGMAHAWSLPAWHACCHVHWLLQAARLPGSAVVAVLHVLHASHPALPRRWASYTCATRATPASCGTGSTSTCATQRCGAGAPLGVRRRPRVVRCCAAGRHPLSQSEHL